MSLRLTAALAGKQHVIWDWNGTILDDLDHTVATINWQLAAHGLATLSNERYREIFDFPLRGYYDRLGFDYRRTSFEDLCHQYVDQYLQGYHHCRPFAVIEQVLVASRALVAQQSILSASEQTSLDQQVAHYELAGLFDQVCGIEDRYARSKLARGQQLIKQSRIDPEKTILVGDTRHDCEVARALGIDILLLDHGHHSRARLLATGAPVISLDG